MKGPRLVGFSLAVCAAALIVAAPASAKTSIPDHGTTALHDNAGALTPATRQQIEADLDAYQAQTTNAVAVLLIKTLDGDSIENYANDVFHQWGLGEKGKDNGVLLVLAMDDHQGRIEVGSGLEGDLSDVEAKDILNTQIFPRLKANDPNEAVRAGEVAIRSALGDANAAAPAPITTTSSSKSSHWANLIPIVIFGAIALFGFLGRGRGRGGFGPGFGTGFGTGVFYGSMGGWGGGSSGDSGGGGGFGGFGGGDSSGGGASGSW